MGARSNNPSALRWLLSVLCVCAWLATACTSTPPLSAAELGVELVLEGVRAVDPALVRSAAQAELRSFERRTSKRAVCDDAAYAVERLYKSLGYSQVRVRWELDLEAGANHGLPRLRLSAEEGQRTLVAALRIRGAKALERERILEVLSESFDAPLDSGRAVFVESEWRQALDALLAAYRERGCLEADLDDEVRVSGADGAVVELEIVIAEGPRFVLRQVDLVPEPASAQAPDLVGPGTRLEFDDLLGEPLSPATLRRVRARVIEAYDSHGYPDVAVGDGRIEALEPGVDGPTRLVVPVAPGPLVHIEEIVLRGNRRTRPQRILGAVSFAPGDRWDVRKERETFRELARSGLFARVNLTLEPELAEQRKLVVEVEELNSREYYIEPGYGSYERLRISAGWSERNLFGSGRALEAKGSLSEFAQSASLSLTDRRFLDWPLQASASLFATQREEPSFETQSVGTGFTLTRRIDREIELGFAYQFRRSDVFGSDLTDPGAQDLLDDVDISSVALSGVFDSRDDPFGPTRGWTLRSWAEYGDAALGSELDYTRLRWSAAHFRELAERLVLALAWRGGTIEPHGGTGEIPLQERFFNGGENTVRSFKESELGLTDSNGEPLGGEGFQVATLELRRRVGTNLEFALFYDAGNLVQEAQNLFDFEGIRTAVGAGLRYHLPVGPVRLDWGINPDPERDESDSVLHVSIGMSF